MGATDTTIVAKRPHSDPVQWLADGRGRETCLEEVSCALCQDEVSFIRLRGTTTILVALRNRPLNKPTHQI